MIEILKFVFSDFWHFVGFLVIISVPCETLIRIFHYIFAPCRVCFSKKELSDLKSIEK